MAKDKCPECKQGAPEWMNTYGDMVTLLMCFFVLLFAFSSIDAQKFEAVMISFQGSAGVLEGGKSLSEAPMIFDAMPESQTSSAQVIEQNKLEALKEKVEQYISDNQMQAEVDVQLEDYGLIIRFKDNVLFDSGSAVVKRESHDILTFLGNLLNSEEFVNEQIRVEGHTDNVPIKTAIYPTNWELSANRATNVVKFFIENASMVPVRLSASGYGEYHPIATNDSSEGRAANRRVDIVVVKTVNTNQNEESQGGQ
ncbi:flagellar motor protein MotB [Fusibacter sp. 3D3]|uniref:OmpA/MotB family protein n=1 Tax=Fusibacter sp. 3D3 TaxID=1048380 RepID=UPI0008538472|nr:flagellar motor protein MotB [Fusibacter sp. 3D3]GAU79867.1 flagellar motor rotation protein MotB [Fusibacter sp. 3D3]